MYKLAFHHHVMSHNGAINTQTAFKNLMRDPLEVPLHVLDTDLDATRAFRRADASVLVFRLVFILCHSACRASSLEHKGTICTRN